ncbi:Spore maturation protein SpmA [Flexibacter flexilis DSM 6793]|uniref:Spore maturation protein SpmA n=1 Tax=Flexibacter flexilis DSM 6793 TaxID=927664 RepID=A0A1I1LBV0_9BACT|nr:spore maturation protein [Flexibacter flexilis]SFC67853.1 Spore maturation protein SpmA [Flexibacter flexilis DSM 6793]
MVLNYIWILFFLIAFVIATIKLVFFGDTEVFPELVNSTMAMSKTAFEISIGLTGAMSLWLGFMRIGEQAGAITRLAKLVNPFFTRLFPEIPPHHPAIGAMLMNFSANMLGLDNAATPLGLKSMKALQELNPNKDTASNAQIMFLVLNASGLTLIPISIMVYRVQMGAGNPADIFLPTLLATFFSTMAGLISVAIYQKINLFDKVILAYLGGVSLVVGLIIWYFLGLPQEQIGKISSIVGNFILFGVLTLFIVLAIKAKINVYETFIEGAKEGFETATKVIPYLVAMLVGIGVFRACGAMDLLLQGITYTLDAANINADFVPALPTALMKPLSGSGARGMMLDAMKTYGADSFVGRLVCVMQGSADTTFYIVAVYFGSVGVRNSRYAIPCGLIADAVGMIAAIGLAYLFFT